MRSCFFIFAITLALYSCKQEGDSYVQSLVLNKSNHKVDIYGYQNGQMISNLSYRILSNSKVEVGELRTFRGITKGNSFGVSLAFADSIIVEFDNVKKSKHNKLYDTLTCYYCLNYDNVNSIINQNSWKFNVLLQDKCALNGEWIYTITEQDYLNAK